MKGQHSEPHIVGGSCICQCRDCLGFVRCICPDCICGGVS